MRSRRIRISPHPSAAPTPTEGTDSSRALGTTGEGPPRTPVPAKTKAREFPLAFGALLYQVFKSKNYSPQKNQHDANSPIKGFGLCFVGKNCGNPRPNKGE